MGEGGCGMGGITRAGAMDFWISHGTRTGPQLHRTPGTLVPTPARVHPLGSLACEWMSWGKWAVLPDTVPVTAWPGRLMGCTFPLVPSTPASFQDCPGTAWESCVHHVTARDGGNRSDLGGASIPNGTDIKSHSPHLILPTRMDPSGGLSAYPVHRSLASSLQSSSLKFPSHSGSF